VTALREKDADRIVGVYAPEIVTFSLAPPLQETGSRVADPAYWKPWPETWTGPITLEVTDLRTATGRAATDLRPEADGA
jgi:ketosteroid isomerase-like protein